MGACVTTVAPRYILTTPPYLHMRGDRPTAKTSKNLKQYFLRGLRGLRGSCFSPRDMGIALGLINLLVRRLVRKGWVRIIRIKPNRVRYLLTPVGIAELSSRLVSGGVR